MEGDDTKKETRRIKKAKKNIIGGEGKREVIVEERDNMKYRRQLEDEEGDT